MASETGFGALYGALDELRQAIRRTCGAEAQIGLSKEYASVADGHAAYLEAMEALQATHSGEVQAAGGRTLTVNGAVSGKNAVTFDGGTVKEGALAGRYILVGGQRAKVVSNTASVLTLDKNVTADDNAVIYPGEGGAEGCAVYGCLFVGKGAYGVVDLSEGTEVIVKPRGSSGTADPLDQRSSVGWKGVHAAAILYDEDIVRVECGSSYSGQDKAILSERKLYGKTDVLPKPYFKTLDAV